MKSIKIINPHVTSIIEGLSKILSKHTHNQVCRNGMNINTSEGSITALDGNVLISVENLEDIKNIDINKTWDVEVDELPVEVEKTKTGVYLTALDGKFPDYKKIIDKTENNKLVECKLVPKNKRGFSVFYSSIIAEQALNSASTRYCFDVKYLKTVYELMINSNVESFQLKLADKDSSFSGIQIKAMLYNEYPMYFVVMPIFLSRN